MAELYKLNLASKPIRNRTVPFLVSGVLVLVTLLSVLFAVSTTAEVAGLDKLTESELKSFEKELDELNQKGENVQRQLTPLQRDLLVGAHRLVASKGFGWSRLFADLEAMLPPRVSTSRIEVERVFKEQGRTAALLEVSVLSADPDSVIQMLDRMRTSGIFRGDIRRQERREVDGKVLNEFALEVVYLPRTDNAVGIADASR
jgi:Tfp pilus assembly protein PilN